MKNKGIVVVKNVSEILRELALIRKELPSPCNKVIPINIVALVARKKELENELEQALAPVTECSRAC